MKAILVMTTYSRYFSHRSGQFLRLASVMILAGFSIWLGLRCPVNHPKTLAPSNPLPDLRGQPAVEHLKQEGLYDTLAEAIDPLFAQETKLTASNGAASHNFGRSIAIWAWRC